MGLLALLAKPDQDGSWQGASSRFAVAVLRLAGRDGEEMWTEAHRARHDARLKGMVSFPVRPVLVTRSTTWCL